MRRTFLILSAISTLALSAPAFSSSENLEPEKEHWAFDGPFGKVDKQSAQRGYQVYKEVCASCHGMKRVAFRELTELGFSEAEAKAAASGYQVQDGPNDEGEMFERAGRASDAFPSPYPNEEAARAANGGALPPDLSLIIKARHDGANYVHALLTGYKQPKLYSCTETLEGGACQSYLEADEAALAADKEHLAAAAKKPATEEAAPAKANVLHCMTIEKIKIDEVVDGAKTGKQVDAEQCHELGEGMYFNPYFPGGQIRMPPPLADGQVSYQGETQASMEQMSHDVTNFLQWASEPEMEHRKSMGTKVMLFLLILTGFLYAVKKRVWRDVE